jgi:DNA-binding NarL/FixJ family response regulator
MAHMYAKVTDMKLLLVDDHNLFSDGLAVLLNELVPNIVIHKAASIAKAEQAVGPFDLMLLDLHLPDAVGYTGIERLKKVHETTPIVIVSGDESTAHIRECINHGAMGFVPKSSNTVDLFCAMKRILSGGTYLPMQAVILDSVEQTPNAKAVTSIHMTKRQHEVLAKVVQGKPNKVIARELGISDNTVKTHVLAVLATLNVSNRTEAVYKAAALGIGLQSV